MFDVNSQKKEIKNLETVAPKTQPLNLNEQELLFGREKLSKLQKTIIIIAASLVLALLVVLGFWLFRILTNTNGSVLADPNIDSDNDGLTDEEEKVWKTSPFDRDTDKDGYLDGEEVRHGYSPLDK